MRNERGALETFQTREVGWIHEARWRSSAVLVPLCRHEGTRCLLFEKRASSLRQQPGEVSFPGGAMNPGESPEEAAVRETQEELCVPREAIEVLGPGDRLLSASGRVVHSFLGVLHHYSGSYSEQEVAYPFFVPLDALQAQVPAVYHNRLVLQTDEHFPHHLVPGGRAYPWETGQYDILFYQWKEEIIWGMTAAILRSALSLIQAYDLSAYV